MSAYDPCAQNVTHAEPNQRVRRLVRAIGQLMTDFPTARDLFAAHVREVMKRRVGEGERKREIGRKLCQCRKLLQRAQEREQMSRAKTLAARMGELDQASGEAYEEMQRKAKRDRSGSLTLPEKYAELAGFFDIYAGEERFEQIGFPERRDLPPRENLNLCEFLESIEYATLKSYYEDLRKEDPRLDEDGGFLWRCLADVRSDLETESAEESQGQIARTAVGAGMPWQKARSLLMEKREANEEFVSYTALARELGCSLATVRKAIENSDSLKGWVSRTKRKHAVRPRAGSFHDQVHAEKVESTRQRSFEEDLDAQMDAADLEDDVLSRLVDEICEKASPEERADIRSKSRDEKAKLAVLYRNQKKDQGNQDRDNRLQGRHA